LHSTCQKNFLTPGQQYRFDLMKTNFVLACALTVTGTLSVSAAPDLSKLPPASKATGVTYAKDVKPMFEASCVRCHGNERPKAGLKLTSLEGVLKGTKDGDKVVIPGKSAESPLVVAVARIDDETAMPPKGKGGRGSPGGEHRAGSPAHSGPNSGTNAAGAQGQGRGSMGPPPKPLTSEQVSLVRAWIDQGAK
jgi:mono/diheme cytochrome c family protein